MTDIGAGWASVCQGNYFKCRERKKRDLSTSDIPYFPASLILTKLETIQAQEKVLNWKKNDVRPNTEENSMWSEELSSTQHASSTSRHQGNRRLIWRCTPFFIQVPSAQADCLLGRMTHLQHPSNKPKSNWLHTHPVHHQTSKKDITAHTLSMTHFYQWHTTVLVMKRWTWLLTWNTQNILAHSFCRKYWCMWFLPSFSISIWRGCQRTYAQETCREDLGLDYHYMG